MTLAELGMALRAEREKRGLTIEDAANHLKIGARLLRAIEDGDEDSLPPLAYAKGFLRAYAAYVGLPEDAVSPVIRRLDDEAERLVPQSPYQPEIPPASGRNFRVFSVLFVLLCLGVGAYVFWQQGAMDFLGRQTRRLAQPAPVEESVPADAEHPVQRGGSPTPSSPADRQAPSGVPATPPSAPDAAAPQRSGEGAATAAPGPEELLGSHKVILTATAECWVHSTADNSDTRQFSLRKGDTFALTFSKTLELKLGNAGGVRLRYNGKEMPLAGQVGQVRTITFPPAVQP